MELAGELLSLIVSLAQEIGIVVGIGALTITLAGHLLSLHAHKNETVFGYVRAARHIRALALMTIIISGGAAVLVHAQTGTLDVLWAPAYLFKWLLIMLLTAFYFVELKVDGVALDAVEGFEGANWYALFIVHTMAPVAAWSLLFGIYLGWLAAFAVIWAAFVWIMRWQSTIPKAKPALAPNPFPTPAVASKPVPPAVPKPSVATVPTPASTPAFVPPPVPKPAAPVEPMPAPAAQKTLEVHPNHSMLPMIAELDLPAPAPIVPEPVVTPIAPIPAPVAPQTIPEPPKAAVQMPDLEESGLPALHVMPKRPEDIESSKRGPVVKMSEE